MRIDVVTIFPEYLDPLRHALLGRAIERGILTVGVHNLRDWAHDVHKAVDDTPFGGGPGMVMKPEVWGPALDDVAALTGPAGRDPLLDSASPHVRSGLRAGKEVTPDTTPGTTPDTDRSDDRPILIVPTPAGRPFTQDMAQRWAAADRLVFACGRYEGIDQRVFTDAEQRYRVEEVSLGDYVLIGGEVAVLVIAEAVVRLIPGVLGNRASHEEDSFQDGLLEGPSYTKPRVWRGLEVPEVLTSGNHAKVDRWRRDESLHRTLSVRPELVAAQEAAGQLDKRDRSTLRGLDGAAAWADPASARVPDPAQEK
ncbi:tRNA (guanosine(37)-N1)-methyltransferase TrmD [uncultured Corynebacterium sp.]|uniref:tRNA (guanosine(37)-N1)-methyltransferase TrmD n=1 Tax=uncultured Corynebacterium sp. TaxID=159447 RepID=UPI0025F68D33|nr:tRNA (guanosine(37)-N1)-methyltransferase TrmD [uncultured Corynebacterium sp.]